MSIQISFFSTMIAILTLFLFLAQDESFSQSPQEIQAAIEIIDKVDTWKSGFNCALHLGNNQCKSLDRCNRSINAIALLDTGTPAAAAEFDKFISASSMQTRCVSSLLGGNFNAVVTSANTIIEWGKQQGGSVRKSIRTVSPFPNFPKSREIRNNAHPDSSTTLEHPDPKVVTSPNQCWDLCLANSQCRAMVWHSKFNGCYLKTGNIGGWNNSWNEGYTVIKE